MPVLFGYGDAGDDARPQTPVLFGQGDAAGDARLAQADAAAEAQSSSPLKWARSSGPTSLRSRASSTDAFSQPTGVPASNRRPSNS